ncbi:MAG: hypothetical protein OXJ53_19340 [Gammaproteobacteria bacterium]|nr:hypothetical protein [Gammaproteobacteria bacterium]
MRELTFDDMDQASGGVLPFIALGVAVGSTFTSGSAAAFLGGVGIGMAGYQAWEYYK